MSTEIRAIIFDYGNVLCEPQPADEIQAMAALAGQPEPRFHDLYWRHRVPYDRAEFDPAAYWSRVAERDLEQQEVDDLVRLDNKSWLHPREPMLKHARSTREIGLRTALLSNLPVPLRDALENGLPWLPKFDVRTYSCTVRAAKPDPAIYSACIRELGIRPPEAVFLDDRPENVAGAIATGIHGLRFESVEKARLDLAAQYGVRLP